LKKSPKLQNKQSPVVRLSNIKNTQSQEFKHNKLSELKNSNKQYISNNGVMKYKNNDSSINTDKGDSITTINHGNIKNEINRMNKTNNISSSINNNVINTTSSSVISSGSINNKNDLSKQNIKYKIKDYDGNSVSIPHSVKSHSINELYDSKNNESQDENPSVSNSIKIRSRKASINREKNRDPYPIKEDDTIILPEYLTKPLIFNVKKQKLQHQEDESDILSIFPEPKKKRLKKTLDTIQNFVNQSLDKEKSLNNQNIFPLPPIQISDI